jgi:hypothetical protein
VYRYWLDTTRAALEHHPKEVTREPDPDPIPPTTDPDDEARPGELDLS